MDKASINRMNAMLDAIFDDGEKAIMGLRSRGKNQLADRMEKEFFPLHDKLMGDYAKMVMMSKNNREWDISQHMRYVNKNITEMQALVDDCDDRRK